MLLSDSVLSQTLSQSSDETPSLRLLRSANTGGIRKVSPGSWALLRTEIQNVSDEDQEAVSVVFFDNDPGLQFARKIWLPAHSRRNTWVPVFVPHEIVAGQTGEFISANANVMLLDPSGGTETVVRESESQLIETSLFTVDTNQPITVQITDFEEAIEGDRNRPNEGRIASLTLQTLRLAAGFPKSVPNMADHRMPMIPALLEAADQIVIRGNRLASDAPGRTAIRQWLQNGGRLWIMLDQMDEETCRLLLGDLCTIEYVDRIGLVEFQSEYSQERKRKVGKVLASGTKASQPSLQNHEYPVEFLRTVVDDVDVVMTIDGWPAVFTKTYGNGSIVFSTIGCRGLSRVRRPGESPIGMEEAVRMPQPELNTIGKLLFERPREVSAVDVLSPLVDQNIGYRVPGRGMVLLILGAFCTGLLLAGIWLSKKDRLGDLLWVAPLAVIIATIPLVAIGTASIGAIPPTVYDSQIVQVSPSGDEIGINGVSGVYQSEQQLRSLTSRSNSVFLPDRTGVNENWRMVWHDAGRWEWENVGLPSGLRLVPVSAVSDAVDQVRVVGTFDEDGFHGRLENAPGDIRDALVASQTHVSLGIRTDDQDLFGPVSNSLPPGQYSNDGMLSDEQIRHQEVYQALMDFGLGQGIKAPEKGEVTITDRVQKKNPDTNEAMALPKFNFPTVPSLLFWSDPVDLGLEFDPSALRRGAALYVVPIQFSRPMPGQNIRIPSVFLPFESVFGPDRSGKSLVFDNELGIWLKSSQPATSWLRFQLPKSILPFQPSSANLRIKVSAPSRPIHIQSGSLEKVSEVGKHLSPTGTLDFAISNPDGLLLDEQGGLHVRIEVGKPSSGSPGVEWKIDHVELQLDGQPISGDIQQLP